MEQCPNCRNKDLGLIADKQYYCWHCYIEMRVTEDKIKVFQVEADGTLSSLDDLFQENELTRMNHVV